MRFTYCKQQLGEIVSLIIFIPDKIGSFKFEKAIHL